MERFVVVRVLPVLGLELAARHRHLQERPRRPDRFQIGRRRELRANADVAPREEGPEPDVVGVDGVRVRSVERRSQNVGHLLRPEHQHVFDGGEADFPDFRRGERVAERQQPARHVGHVLPPRQDGGDLAAASVQPDSLDLRLMFYIVFVVTSAPAK